MSISHLSLLMANLNGGIRIRLPTKFSLHRQSPRGIMLLHHHLHKLDLLRARKRLILQKRVQLRFVVYRVRFGECAVGVAEDVQQRGPFPVGYVVVFADAHV